MGKLDKGFLQIYTGGGKGKTTAAIGQAVRAAGHGLKIHITQFMKDYPYNELIGLKYLADWISIDQYCTDAFVFKKEPPSEELINQAKIGLAHAKEKMLSSDYDMVILDEVLVSIYFGLFQTEEIIEFVNLRPENVELILTGRYCPDELIELADLVTEMKEVKHYYQKGVLSRKGIES